MRSNGFYVAPQVGYNAKATQVVPSFMMWDKGGRRFVMCANQFYSLGIDDSQDIPMDRDGSDGFPTVNEGLFAWPKRADRLDLIHMENTRYDRNQDDNGVTYAVLGKGNDRWLYGIILGNLYSFVEPKYGPAYEKTCYVSLSGCTDIAKADHYAFSSLKNFMYYSGRPQCLPREPRCHIAHGRIAVRVACRRGNHLYEVLFVGTGRP